MLEIIPGSKTTKHFLLLGEVQSANVPGDLHSISVLCIPQTVHKLSGEFLQQSCPINRAGLALVDRHLALMITENFLL